MRCVTELRELFSVVSVPLSCRYFDISVYRQDIRSVRNGKLDEKIVHKHKQKLVQAISKAITQARLTQKYLSKAFGINISGQCKYTVPHFTDSRCIDTCKDLIQKILIDISTTVNQVNPNVPHGRRVIELANYTKNVDKLLRA